MEYFISAHGARKGLADTALKTANSGYLTRRLVDVSQDCIVIEEDCGTHNGLLIEPVIDDGRTIVSLAENCLGRVPLEDVKTLDGKRVLVEAGQMIDEALADEIDKSGIKSLRVRSVLTCESKDGVCVKCYGRDLATGNIVSIGEAVGVAGDEVAGGGGEEDAVAIVADAAAVAGEGGLDSFAADAHAPDFDVGRFVEDAVVVVVAVTEEHVLAAVGVAGDDQRVLRAEHDVSAVDGDGGAYAGVLRLVAVGSHRDQRHAPGDHVFREDVDLPVAVA
jgi:DNA-directed RNA polymerase subunit beta'